MMNRSFPPVRLVLAAFVLSAALPVAARGQAADDAVSPGPTRDALMATALRLSSRDAAAPEILHRYQIYAQEFDAHFLPDGSTESEDFMASVDRRLATRYGDTSLYQWLQRGLVLYARFKAFTEVEHRGFNMQVEVEDVAEGKLGVRVDRALE
ncbi:MAG TPA: hypothetical protein VM778_04175 [Gemmatimonadota bacterium]|nr:hypothetical protein [Gemmatimonadota bacterium]